MDETFVEDAENDVDGGESGEDKHENGGLRILKRLRSTLKAAVDGGRHVELGLCFLNLFYGVTQRKRWV